MIPWFFMHVLKAESERFDLTPAHLVELKRLPTSLRGPRRSEESSDRRSLGGDDSRSITFHLEANKCKGEKSVLVLLRFSTTKGIKGPIKAAASVIRVKNKKEK